MKTLIAIPCFDKIDTSFAKSLLYMNTVGECEISFVTGTLIYDARDKIAEGAIEAGFDYILWLDSDMNFEPDLMEKMFASIGDKDFMSGLYFTRRNEPKPCIFDKCRADVSAGEVIPTATSYYDYPLNSVFEIEACGFGCVLMKVSMLKEVTEKMGLPFMPAFGFGEDLSFCMRARQLGYKLWCDSSVKLGHNMIVESNEQMYMLRRAVTIGTRGSGAGSVAPPAPFNIKE